MTQPARRPHSRQSLAPGRRPAPLIWLGAATLVVLVGAPHIRPVHRVEARSQVAPASPSPGRPSSDTAEQIWAVLERSESLLVEIRVTQVQLLAQLQAVEDLAPALYRPLVVAAARRHGLEPRLLAALVDVETGRTWDPCLRGRHGEIGLTQVLPATAKWIARALQVDSYNLCDPATSLEFGAWYLAQQLHRNKGDIVKALREFNGGPSWFEKPATERYANQVIKRMER